MCDLFLVLAQTDEGVTCFALPRILPDGARNAGFQLQRLKDKLGNRSNASSEVEFRGALARMVGDPGRGVPTIIEMVNHTRLDCVFGAAGGMRAAVANATWHAAHRSAFGARLIEQPLMVNVLADLAIESEAATAVAMRLARAYDEAPADPRAEAFKRIATAVAKYHVCKRAPGHEGDRHTLRRLATPLSACPKASSSSLLAGRCATVRVGGVQPPRRASGEPPRYRDARPVGDCRYATVASATAQRARLRS
jgi:putative acyl-CoA dehydrogenase